MFGLRRKLNDLENRLEKIERERDCAKGNHFWIMQASSYTDKPPYIRCAYCWESPKEEKNK